MPAIDRSLSDCRYIEKQKEIKKAEKYNPPPPPQFVAEKPAYSQEVMEAHLPPHLAELVKKQTELDGGTVEYKTASRGSTAKSQLQRESEDTSNPYHTLVARDVSGRLLATN